tara:strand:+ start:4012 stop:6486 length:2475 start_codon:yes stop_codon:yes gene_type:complete
MASLTDTLPTSSAVKPVNQPVQAPDYAGTISDLFGTGLKILGAQRDAEATAASKAASEARANATADREAQKFDRTKNEWAAADAVAGALSWLSPADAGEMDRLSKLGAAGGDVESRSRALYARVANQYGPQAAYKAFKEVGLSNALTRQADEEQALATARNEAGAATIKTFSARADLMGLDPTLDITERNRRGRESLAGEYNFNMKKLEREEKEALFNQQQKVDEWELTQNSREQLTNILQTFSPWSSGLIDQLGALTSGAQDDEDLAFRMQGLGPDLQNAIDLARKNANAMAITGQLQQKDVDALNSWFDTQETILQNAIKGDLSTTSTMTRRLKLLQDTGAIKNWMSSGQYMRFKDAVGDAGIGVIVGMIATETFNVGDEARQQLRQGFIDLWNGVPSEAATEAQRALDEYTSFKADPSKMQFMSQASARRTMQFASQALPEASKRFVQNSTNPDAQDDYFETARGLTYAAASITPSTEANDYRGQQYVNNVTALMENRDFQGALLKLDQVAPGQAAIVRDNLSQALFNAFQTERVKAENLSRRPVVTEGKSYGKGVGAPGFTVTGKRSLKFNKQTGMFEGENMDGAVEKLNKLLDYRTQIEGQRGSLNSLKEDERRLFLATSELSVGEANASDIPTDMSGREKMIKGIDALEQSLRMNAINPESMMTPPKVAQIPTDLASLDLSGVPKAIQEYLPDIQEVSQALGLPPSLITVMMQRESYGDPSAESSKGAFGLMQLMPDTAAELGVDPRDPRQNIEGGARYIKMMLDKYDGDLVTALMAYNWGPGNVDKWRKSGGVRNVPQETQDYVEYIIGKLGYDISE